MPKPKTKTLKSKKPKVKKPARKPARQRPGTATPASDPIAAAIAASADTDAQILASNLTLHQLFAQQSTAMLDRADLSDEQKQSLLIAMSCPCCGAGGFSFTAKLRR
jgi:hypothetical protein